MPHPFGAVVTATRWLRGAAWLLIFASLTGLGCERAAPSVNATSGAPPISSAPQLPAPSASIALPPPSASAPTRPSPLASTTPIVPKAERDAAVQLCCKMFDPYVTGCVKPMGVCPHRMKGHCEDAWKRGATLADIEPGLRRLAPLDRYYVPPQCMASAASKPAAAD